MRRGVSTEHSLLSVKNHELLNISSFFDILSPHQTIVLSGVFPCTRQLLNPMRTISNHLLIDQGIVVAPLATASDSI